MGGGAPGGCEKLPEVERTPAEIGGFSSVGLPPREFTGRV